MSKLKATPGTWKAFQWGDGSQDGTDFWNVGSDSAEVVFAKDLPLEDAHLIAAAPDLYEALEAARDSIIERLGNERLLFKGYEHASSIAALESHLAQSDRALAKARGEEGEQ
jgi:hypothetical protein